MSAKKNFDIPHPTKEGWRLRHTCPEGPSNDVYFRGRISNKDKIYLPKYWEELVDPTTITVNLTPIGAHQNVIVKELVRMLFTSKQMVDYLSIASFMYLQLVQMVRDLSLNMRENHLRITQEIMKSILSRDTTMTPRRLSNGRRIRTTKHTCRY